MGFQQVRTYFVEALSCSQPKSATRRVRRMVPERAPWQHGRAAGECDVRRPSERHGKTEAQKDKIVGGGKIQEVYTLQVGPR